MYTISPNKFKSSSELSNIFAIALALLFALLYTVWGLPETILIRNLSLVFGALISLYFIYTNHKVFRSITAFPLWLIFALFIWRAVQFSYFNADINLQTIEVGGTWKRALLSFIFAIGLGIAATKVEKKLFSFIIFLGFLGPTLIFYIKYFFFIFNIDIFYEFLKLTPDYFDGKFYIPKTTYVNFCLPFFALCLGILFNNFKKMHQTHIILMLFLLISVEFVFIFFKITNGIVWSLFLTSIFLFLLLNASYKKLVLTVFLILLTALLISYLYDNSGFIAKLIAPINTSLNVHVHNEWKFPGNFLTPFDTFNDPVSPKIYMRVAWAAIAVELIFQNPLGYGLIESSFHHLTHLYWPDSNILNQCHSGWLDLIMAIGLPGISLVWLSMFLSLVNLYKAKTKLNVLIWPLSSIIFFWITTEVSQKTYFESLIFMIAFTSAASLPCTKAKT